MECSTPRLLIRPVTFADIENALVSWSQGRASVRFLDAARRVLSRRSLKKTSKASRKTKDSILFGVSEKNTEKKIESMRVRRIDEWSGLASLGYLIRNSSSRGQGIATEELTSLSDCILSPRGLSASFKREWQLPTQHPCQLSKSRASLAGLCFRSSSLMVANFTTLSYTKNSGLLQTSQRENLALWK